MEFGFKDGAGVIFEAANDRRIYLNTIWTITGGLNETFYRLQFPMPFSVQNTCWMHFIILQVADDESNLLRSQARALGEISGFILPACPEEQFDALKTEFVELVDRPQNTQSPSSIFVSTKVGGFHDTVDDLAVIHPDHIVAARNAERFHRIGHHHAHFGVRLDTGGADRVGVELHELAEAARAGLFVAEDIAGAVGAVGQLDIVEIFRNMTGKRRRQVVAGAHPLLVIVLQRKHAFVRAVAVGQEFSKRIGIFEQRCFDGIETVALVDLRGSLRSSRRRRGYRRRSDRRNHAAAGL